ADVDPRIGSLVDGRYKIHEAMASGSMGAVYKAERVPVGKLVAIKFLHASYAKDSEFLTRFERETRVMSKLSHPNCVSVVDFGVWEGAPYLVMEYVAGKTLRATIDADPIGPHRALNLTRQIAAGLAHAHSQGVVHRDIKPANIMISDEVGTGDHVRILDFGLARLRGHVGRDATQTNVVVGTPNYMAPEQTIGGGTIDARTDLYAVGVVLFEMIAGERPYSSDDTLALLGMHRAAPIPNLADRIDRSIALPMGVQQLIDKLMAKAPDDRFQSAIELAQAVEEILGPRVSAEHQIVSPRGRHEPASTAIGIAATEVDIDSGRVATQIKDRTEPVRQPRKSGGSGGLIFLVLLAAAAAGVYYVKFRPGAAGSGSAAGSATVITVGPAGAVPAGSGSAMASVVSIDAPVASVAPVVPIVIDAAVAPVVDAAVDPPGVLDASEEIEMDPAAATNPDPTADEVTADEEAPDAPEPTADVEAKLPVAPTRAQTVAEAIQMIKEGKRTLAMSSLHALGKKSPKRGDIPFLLGNLYYDKLWWGVALEHYKLAIQKNGGYRSNGTLIKNSIRMLASDKTRRTAQGFLRYTIKRPALSYLKTAAKNDPNGVVRKHAAALARSIR
ncbi:MAG: serine/threonine protein kinase, partial [Deltaproteobacteria bacterium]|nr:serine/threonine protein kinase [Deltaproteobacteria bacterium]